MHPPLDAAVPDRSDSAPPFLMGFRGAEPEAGLLGTETLFARGGSWLVLTSRWLPVFPEAVSCLAGLARMPFKTFLAASATGSLPMGFAFAGIGALAQERQGLAMGLSIILPVLSWLIGRRLIRC